MNVIFQGNEGIFNDEGLMVTSVELEMNHPCAVVL